MRPRERVLILACGVVALGGCERKSASDEESADRPEQTIARASRDVDPARMPDASGPRPRGGYTPLAVRDSLLRTIEAGEQKWRASRPAGYSITVVAACFCRDRGLPVVLTVHGDSVVASRDTTWQQTWPDDWRTGLHVAGLFREARQFVCDSTQTTRVTLDRRLGYPRLLATESRLEVSDSDREYRVLSFAAEGSDR
jgi:hypothetical protein